MKVGILSYHFANNYGAAMQVYSMQTVLEGLGVESEFVNFVTDVQKSNNSVFENNNCIKNMIKNFVRIPHLKNRKIRFSKFEDFRRKYLNISSQCIASNDDISSLITQIYDCLVIGSDQVWNPQILDFNEIYYKISSSDIPAIAYAASLGAAKKNDILPYIDYIKKFKQVSVREKSSIEFLQSIDSTIKVTDVLDPTMLISQNHYIHLSSNGLELKKPYILCYYLGRENSIKAKKFAYMKSKELNIPVYFLNTNYGIISYDNHTINNAGPEDFVSLIRDASLVLTNSFHGTALSIKMGKAFYNFESRTSNDSRKSDLLINCGITDRAIYDFDLDFKVSLDNEFAISTDIFLKPLIDKSLDFLKNNIHLKGK